MTLASPRGNGLLKRCGHFRHLSFNSNLFFYKKYICSVPYLLHTWFINDSFEWPSSKSAIKC
jgi:hypothetical protein